MKSSDYFDTLFCDHCQKETEQKVHDSGHERDSSGDSFTCLECGWYKSGWSDKYHSLEFEDR